MFPSADSFSFMNDVRAILASLDAGELTAQEASHKVMEAHNEYPSLWETILMPNEVMELPAIPLTVRRG